MDFGHHFEKFFAQFAKVNVELDGFGGWQVEEGQVVDVLWQRSERVAIPTYNLSHFKGRTA
jgi:hypothetical protein